VTSSPEESYYRGGGGGQQNYGGQNMGDYNSRGMGGRHDDRAMPAPRPSSSRERGRGTAFF